MKISPRTKLAAAVTGTLLVVGPVAWRAAARSAPEPVHVKVISRSLVPGGVPASQIGDSDLQISVLTLRPGASTAWHSHPGPVVVSVIRGTATFVSADCARRDYHAGEGVAEAPGTVHATRNDGREDLVFAVVFILPPGADAGVAEATPPGCPD